MVQHFISNITNNDLFNKQPNISLDGILNYYDTKEVLITYESYNQGSTESSNENFEIIDDLNEEEEKEKEAFIKTLSDEETRVKKIMEYFIVNFDINKITIPNYKIYDYSNTPKHLRNKINTNHPFDLKKFLIKNGIAKGELIPLIERMTNKKANELNLNETKTMIYFILTKVFEIYNAYNKSISYSKEILKEKPLLYKNKEALVSLNPNLMKLDINNNNKIELFHLNTIKNAFAKTTNKDKKTATVSINSSTTIVIEKTNINFK